MDKTFDLYRDIAERTDGDVYIGVVGPAAHGQEHAHRPHDGKARPARHGARPRRDRLSDELPRAAAAAPS